MNTEAAYRPPRDEPVDAVVRICSVRQIALATLIGGVPAGMFLLAQNYRQMGRSSRWRVTLGVGVVLSVAVFWLKFQTRGAITGLMLMAAYTMAMKLAADLVQGPAIQAQLAGGARQHAYARVMMIALAGLVLELIIGLASILGRSGPG